MGLTLTDLGRVSADNSATSVQGIVVLSGTLYASTGGHGHVCRWDGGTTWTDVGFPESTSQSSKMVAFGGKLYANNKTALAETSVYRYDGGTTWTDVGSGSTGASKDVTCLCVFDGKLYAGNGIDGHVYAYDGASWSDAGHPWDDAGQNPVCLCVHGGKLYAGMDGNGAGNGRVYEYGGETTWSSLGDIGTASTPNAVWSLVSHDGGLYAGVGDASPDSGHVYKWAGGTTWTDVGVPGDSCSIYALASAFGSMYAGSDGTDQLYVYSGSGTTWTTAATVADSSQVTVLYPGSLYVGTYDSSDKGHVQRLGYESPGGPDRQYRPITNREWSQDDACSVRAIRDLTDNINNFKNRVQCPKLVSEIWPADTKTRIIVDGAVSTGQQVILPPLPPFFISKGYGRLMWTLQHRLLGGDSVTWRLYLHCKLYRGADDPMDLTALDPHYQFAKIVSTSTDWTFTTETLPFKYAIDIDRRAWLVFAAEPYDSGASAEIRAIDVYATP